MSPLKAEFSLTSGKRKSEKYSLAGLGRKQTSREKKKERKQTSYCVLTLGAKTCEMWPLGIKSSSLLLVRKWGPQSSGCRGMNSADNLNGVGRGPQTPYEKAA